MVHYHYLRDVYLVCGHSPKELMQSESQNIWAGNTNSLDVHKTYAAADPSSKLDFDNYMDGLVEMIYDLLTLCHDLIIAKDGWSEDPVVLSWP